MNEEKYILHKGIKIYYRVYGKGSAVLLLHGFGETGDIWNSVADDLSSQYFVVVPDLPGSGKSQMISGENVTMDSYADVIKQITDEEFSHSSSKKNSGFTLIGHSMGGYIALAFADKYPSLLNGLGLFHSTAFADTPEKISTRKKGIEFISNNGSAAFLKTSVPGLFSNTFKKDHQQIVEELIREGRHFAPEALIQYYHAMISRPEKKKILESISCPVLFISGEKDIAVPLQNTLQECILPNISHLHIFENAAHMGMLEEKNESMTSIFEFLDKIA